MCAGSVLLPDRWVDSLAEVQRPSRPALLRLAAPACALALALAGCGGSSDSGGTGAATAADSTSGAEGAPSSDDAGATDIYFTTGEQFRTVERDIPEGSPEERLSDAAEELMAGPSKREAATEVETTSQIPAGTEVRGVELDGDTAVVAVSPEFTRGVPADPAARNRSQRAEIDARLAQVTYTLTQFPQVERAKVVAGGRPVRTGGREAGGSGEDEAQDRSDFDAPAQGPQAVQRPRGKRSLSVKALQQRLAELKYLPKSAVDGIDGYRTQQAVLAFQSWRGLARDGVVGPATQAALAKAGPPRPHGDGPSGRIEVYRDRGVTLLIKNDRTKRAIHVSTGGPGNETPAGTFEVFRKELKSWSVPFQVWLPYASYFNNGIAFHEYPDVPVYPASHGCVRVPAPEAPGVYRFAKLGTTVIVY